MSYNRKKITELFPEIDQIKDRDLAEKTIDMWMWFWEHGNYEDLESAIFTYNSCGVTLVQHIKATLKGAMALAQILIEVQDAPLNMDHIIVLSLLHDISKLIEYNGADENGLGIKTTKGKAYTHAFLGASKAEDMGFPPELVANILYHTPQSKFPVNTREAYVMLCADKASARMISQKFTD